MRLGGTIFYASRLNDWKSLEKVTVKKWLTRLSGKKTFDKIWKPLLMAKLGEAYRETSAAFIWATIQRMYAARKSGLKKEMFGYVRGGYARVLEAFSDHLTRKGVNVRVSTPVEKVSRNNESCLVLAGGGESKFDEVILTCTPSTSVRLIEGLSNAESARLKEIKYQGIVLCVRSNEGPAFEVLCYEYHRRIARSRE